MSAQQHTSKQIAGAAAMLGSMLRAGLGIDASAIKLNGSYPGIGWDRVAERTSRGERLSDCLVGIWPESLVSAVAAGDKSGRLGDVMRQIVKTMEVKKEIAKAMTGFYGPGAYMIGGIGAALYYAIAVMPTMAKASKSMLGAKYKPGIGIIMSERLQDLVYNHWLSVSVVLAGIITGIAWLFRQPEFKDWLFIQADKIPVLNEALRKLYFGLWAQTMAMMAASGGIDITQMLTLSANILPVSMRAGVIKMAAEVERRGLSAAGDPQEQPDDDPRRSWPLYIGIAFISAGQTGDIAAEMSKVSPELIEEGMSSLKLIIAIASYIAMALSGLLIAMAPIMMLLEQGQLFQQTMKM